VCGINARSRADDYHRRASSINGAALEGQMPYRAVAAEALAAWRAAQARLVAAVPQSEEWQAASVDEQAAKAAYQEAADAAHREHLPEPPPFADTAAADAASEEPETTMTPPKTDGQVYGG
jgi:hypothetical protein